MILLKLTVPMEGKMEERHHVKVVEYEPLAKHLATHCLKASSSRRDWGKRLCRLLHTKSVGTSVSQEDSIRKYLRPWQRQLDLDD